MMHEITHRWSDAYGAEMSFTVIAGDAGQVGTDYAYMFFHNHSPDVDIVVEAHDLRALAAAAIAAADLIDANKEKPE